MKNSQKRFTVLSLGLFIIAVIVLGIAGYLYYMNPNHTGSNLSENSADQEVVALSAVIDTPSLTISSLDSTSTITGVAAGTNTVSVSIIASTPAKFNPYSTLLSNGDVRVTDGHWIFAIPPQISKSYFEQGFSPLTVEVGVVSQTGDINSLATGTLNIKPSYEGNVSMSIDQKTLNSASRFPNITGTATNTPSLTVDIDGSVPQDGSDSYNQVAWYAGTVSVVNNRWSFTPSASNEARSGGLEGLLPGTYTVIIGTTGHTPFEYRTLVVSAQ